MLESFVEIVLSVWVVVISEVLELESELVLHLGCLGVGTGSCWQGIGWVKGIGAGTNLGEAKKRGAKGFWTGINPGGQKFVW